MTLVIILLEWVVTFFSSIIIRKRVTEHVLVKDKDGKIIVYILNRLINILFNCGLKHMSNLNKNLRFH